jgi:hypothetical protein
MTIKGILVAAGILAVAFLVTPGSKTAAPHDSGPVNIITPRTPYPCESDYSIQCTWREHQQIAEEECARDRAQGRRCEIVTNGQPPHAVHIPSDNDFVDMRRKIDEGVKRLCDDFANAGHECRTSDN